MWFLAGVATASMAALYVLSFFSTIAANVLWRWRLSLTCFLHFFFSSDKSWSSKLPDPDLIQGKAQSSVRIVFMRHGESEWNQVFNKGFGPSFVVRLVRALILEILSSVKRHSVFIDSPLSLEGVQQAHDVIGFLDTYKPTVGSASTDEIVSVIRGDRGRSVVVSSNLRRAIETCTIALVSRLRRSKEKIQILSSLQEISRNVDTLALAGPRELPEVSALSKLPIIPSDFKARDAYDVTRCAGNKPVRGNGLQRMRAFAHWATEQDVDTIIVSGHSLYFRYFFKTFLPHTYNHAAKTRKMVNCGMVSFVLERGQHNSETLFRIQPESVTTVYGGFM